MKRTIVWETTQLAFPICLIQTGVDRFVVQYGKQVDSNLCYRDAASKLGEAIMHALACDDKLDNRTKEEARHDYAL